jgi:hypothetical protein
MPQRKHGVAAQEGLAERFAVAVPELGVDDGSAEGAPDQAGIDDGEGESEPDDGVGAGEEEIADVVVVAVEDPAVGVAFQERSHLVPEFVAGEVLPVRVGVEDGVELDERDVEAIGEETTHGRLAGTRGAVDHDAAPQVDRLHEAVV